MIVLDTVVVSELRKGRPEPLSIAWMRGSRKPDAFPGVMTAGEIERGQCNVRPA